MPGAVDRAKVECARVTVPKIVDVVADATTVGDERVRLPDKWDETKGQIAAPYSYLTQQGFVYTELVVTRLVADTSAADTVGDPGTSSKTE